MFGPETNRFPGEARSYGGALTCIFTCRKCSARCAKGGKRHRVHECSIHERSGPP